MDFQIDLRGESCVLLAVLCLILPLDWVLAAAAAAAVHEGCHILAVFLLGGTIHRLKIGACGAKLDASPLAPWQELLAVLAGPMGSFSLLLLRGILPQMALCGSAQGIFNLLPIYPLDGGRALRCICGLLLSPAMEEQACRFVSLMTCGCLLVLGLWGSFAEKLGIAPLMFVLLLLVRAGFAKKSCKEGNLRVQ